MAQGSGDIHVSYSLAGSAAEDLASATRDIETTLGDLDTALDQLRTQGWSGYAADQYAGYKAKWLATAEQMRQVLAKSSGVIDEAMFQYDSKDRHLASSWAMLR